MSFPLNGGLYTHIGMQDQATALDRLSWQHSGSNSALSERQRPSAGVANGKPDNEETSACDKGSVVDCHHLVEDERVEAAGIEHESRSPQQLTQHKVAATPHSVSAFCQHPSSSRCLDLAAIDAGLRRVIEACPHLNDAVRSLVEAVCLRPVSGDICKNQVSDE